MDIGDSSGCGGVGRYDSEEVGLGFEMKFILKITELLVKVSNMNLVWYLVAV